MVNEAEKTSINMNEISDMALEMEIALEKALYMSEEVIERYFSKSNIHSDKESQLYIIHEYQRNEVFSRIAVDNIREMKKKLGELQEYLCK